MDNATDLLNGKLIRLAAQDPEEIAPLYVKWAKDPEYLGTLESDPLFPFSAQTVKTQTENDWPADDLNNIMFAIRTLTDDKIIGFADLDYMNPIHGDTYMGIGIGEKEYWGKGYGSDAMNVLLRYAFNELDLHRVTLTVFAFNERAIRMYERTGFKIEGRHRGYLYRDGRRWDLVEMGILKNEWQDNRVTFQGKSA
jgi:RimJ/RimL family protein N-acetyltransferase